jgi:lactate racemase
VDRFSARRERSDTFKEMKIELAFGKTGLAASLPEGPQYQFLEARSATALPDGVAALEAAMDSPIGTLPVAKLARGKKTAAISVCDITRPAPNRLVLPPLLKRLEQGGISRENVTVLIATGLHRPATEDEIREIIGPDLYGHIRVVNHHAKVLAEHRYLGDSSTGTPVHIDERFMAADLHITLGFIEPHLMLGFSGGRKLIAPGLAAQETIKVLHSPKFMRDTRAVEGSVADNPLHRELLEIARKARHDFLIDVALTRDRKIAQVFAGHPEQAHRQGMEFVGRVMLERIDEPVDAVITTSAGYPLDLTFYQTVKGITAASHIVKPGGRILVISACTEGAGAPEFCEMLESFPTPQAFLDHVAAKPVVVDQWQLEKLALVCRDKQLFFHVPGLEPRYRDKLWGKDYPTVNEAILAAVAGLGPSARVAVIPEGPYVLARVEEPVMA